MSDKEKLDLLVKQYKQKQEDMKIENVMQKKWADALQNKTPLFTKTIKF